MGGVKPLDDACVERAAALYRAHGSKRAAAKAAGLPRSTFNHHLARAAQRGLLGSVPVLPGFEIKETSAQKDAAGRIEREWVRQRRALGDAFVAAPGQSLKGESALIDPDGRVIQKWVKTDRDKATPVMIEALQNVFAAYRGRAKLVPKPRRIERDLLTVYPIADQHNGLLAWGRETGEAYDLKIGTARLRACMAQLVAQSRPSRLAIVLNLGDWQHTDDQRNMTPRGGNLLDVDSRYRKIVEAGLWLMIDCIDLALRKHGRVIVRNLPGNHDPHACVALTLALAMFYRGNRRVTIDDDPGDCFFHAFGTTLIGANHGHKMRPSEMAMMMATRRAADWGRAQYRVFYHGHIHHESAREVGDCRVESFRTIAGMDAHAVSRGYAAGRSLVAITHHRRDGEIGRHRVNIPPPRLLAGR